MTRVLISGLGKTGREIAKELLEQEDIRLVSFSRKAFALGALKAVRFAKGKSGYFEMSDVLNLKKVLSDYMEKDRGLLGKRYRQNNVNNKGSAELWAN